jgi:hypothetical protein
VLAFVLLAAGTGHAQAPPGAGQVVTPGSSVQQPEDTGVRAHTNIEIFVPNRAANGTQAPPGTGTSRTAGSRSQAPEIKGMTSPAQPR